MDDGIAIISYSFRFPGIETEEMLWKLLVSKGNTFTQAPANRNLEIPLVGSFFKDPDLFDNTFFHLSTQEARAMDRQQRILLELAWHCFEASHISLEKLQKETTGVFVGSMLLNQKQAESSEKECEKYLALGVSESILSNRLSYFLRCNGPSVTINTACSSSIAALHAAKEALLAKRCQYAFVGAGNMIDNDLRFRSYKEMGILSQTLPYRAFSRESSGFVPGEGGVVVLLTTCEKAVSEGIPIYGVIRGSALNHTGFFSPKSLTAPSVRAQAEVIQNALKDAGLKPNEIDYLECHGTGTLVGDPIELAALDQVYGSGNRIYPIGSIKHNIGHLEACAGLASVIKALLMFQYDLLLPNASFDQINPLFPLISQRFDILTSPRSYEKKRDGKRRVAISSFGFGGTNSHLILEEGELLPKSNREKYEKKEDVAISYPFVISAKEEKSLKELKKKWVAFLSSRSFNSFELESLSFQLLQINISFKYRFGIVFQNCSDLIEKLTKEESFSQRGVEEQQKMALHLNISHQIASYEDFLVHSQALAKLLQNGFNPTVCLAEKEMDLGVLFCAVHPSQIKNVWGNLNTIETLFKDFSFPFPVGQLSKQTLYASHQLKKNYLSNLKPIFIEEVLAFKTNFLDQYGKADLFNNQRFLAHYRNWEQALEAYPNRNNQFKNRETARTFALFSSYYSLIHYWDISGNLQQYKSLREIWSFLHENWINPEEVIAWLLEEKAFTQKIVRKSLFNSTSCWESPLNEVFIKEKEQFDLDLLQEELKGFALCILGKENESIRCLFLHSFAVPSFQDTSSYLNLWQCGVPIQLASLFSVKSYGKVPMPLYPFQRTRIEELPTSSPVFSQGMTEKKDPLFSFIKSLLADVLKRSPEGLDQTTRFEHLGINSLNITQITQALSDAFGPQPATLLYEYNTLGDLCSHFKKKRPQLEDMLKRKPYDSGRQPSSSVELITNPLRNTAQEIAIIGVAARLPGGTTLEEFWTLLSNGQSAITMIPSDRWDLQGFYSQNPKMGTSYTCYGGFIEDIKRFDALFFNISPREALQIDPQERLFLECAWKAVEDAGYRISSINKQKIGVFAGVTNGLYGWNDPGLWQKQIHANVSSAYWSVANRVSYCLNLMGPSLAVDTACSSSLTALHLAIQSLQQNECDYALAGASSLIIHPRQYTELCDLKMLSSGDKLKAFGKDADGFVYGEGVGVVLLKRLSDALRDKDPIYAVLCGSSIGATGKTSGYTVPSPNAQAEVIQTAVQKAGIDYSQITYVEAHGTGTSLGDPIEIRGLIKAWDQKQYTPCLIGSVKSNIGHLEAAAGMASLIKVLLQLQHREIVPSLHCKELNPKVDFENTSFSVSQFRQKWGKETQETLYAGISSFGAGGANAHLIVRSTPQTIYEDKTPCGFFPIFLSAKDREALLQKIKDLHHFLSSNPSACLENIAYTLAMGREHFSERWACIVFSLQQLRAELENYMRNDLEERVRPIGIPEEMIGWMNSYLSGAIPNMESIFSSQIDFRKLHLPTYPFQGASYWISPRVQKQEVTKNMHSPFLITKTMQDKNKTILCFIISVKEFYFSDHILDGRYILPGVVHLELVRVASQKVMEQTAPFHFSKLTWAQPILGEMDQEVEVQVHMVKKNDTHYSFKIMDQKGTLLHSQGEVSKQSFPIDKKGSEKPPFPAERMNFFTNRLQKEEIYTSLSKLGWKHGPSLQTIECIYATPQKTDEAIAHLKLDPTLALSSLSSLYAGFLHPSIMDGILQSVISPYILNLLPNQKPALPFGFDSLKIYNQIPLEGWVHIQRKTPENTLTQQHDLWFYDVEGNLCLVIQGFKARKEREKEIQASQNLSYYYPIWERFNPHPISMPTRIGIVGNRSDPQTDEWVAALSPDFFINHSSSYLETGNGTYEFDLLQFEMWRAFFQQQRDRERVPEAMVYLMSSFEEEPFLADHIWGNFRKIFSLIKGAIHSRAKQLQVLVIGENTAENECKASFLLGFGKTLSREHPAFSLQILLMDRGTSTRKQIRDMLEQFWSHKLHSGIYKSVQGVLYEQRYASFQPNRSSSLLKQKGRYIITGGLGGLGKALTQHLAAKYQASIVLASRSLIQEETQKNLYEFRRYFSEVVHVQCDISKEEEVKKLLLFTLSRFGGIDGIFHAAGTLKDSLLYNKELEYAHQVFLPKVNGLIHIHENLKALGLYDQLDFIVNFSSISAVLGNIGQGDYSCANAFMDSYTSYMRNIVSKGKTQVISLNWPYWKMGGMQVSDEIEKIMHEKWGISALATENGIQALETILGHKALFPSIIVAPDIKAHFKNLLPLSEVIGQEKQEDHETISSKPASAQKDLLMQRVKEIIKDIQHIDLHLINPFVNLADYGFNSLAFTTFSNRLNEVFSVETTPALFFEVTTVDEIAEFLLKNTRILNEPPIPQEIKKDQEVVLQEGKKIEEGIAIVGLAGQMPGSETLDEFWQNMVEGKNVISEIPSDRWAWRDYYGDPASGNKTNVKYGVFLKNYDMFDADFFGINGREATFMDPQHRIFLENAWVCIEDAGYTPDSLSKSRTGLFVGVSTHDYLTMLSQHPEVDVYTSTGSVHCLLPNRVSYFLNLTGPSESIDTACSSSLVAIHRAVTSLQSGECDFALAGGVNALLHPIFYISFSKAGMLSEDGKCKTFDKDASGYVRGEGVGVVLLKRLADAIRDKDHIYGVILGSAVNHGGKTNTLTSPSPKAQSTVIQDALARAKIDPTTISYIEAHGTGTPLGDPIEVNALKSAFAEAMKKDSPVRENLMSTKFCGIGSVKTHIGHLEPAAGIAGVIKVLLAFKHELLPKSLHFHQLNPYINLDNTPFYIQHNQISWSRQMTPRRAGISSFGFGGVNSHIVLEDPPLSPLPDLELEGPFLLTLSAKTPSALHTKIVQLLEWMRLNHGRFSLQDLTFTLNLGRQPMAYRLCVLFSHLQELTEKLKDQRDISQFSLVKGIQGMHKPVKHCVELGDIKEKEDCLIKLQEAFLMGYQIDWEYFYKGSSCQRLSLPTYPFERKRYWISHQPIQRDSNRKPAIHTDLATSSAIEIQVPLDRYSSIIENHKINDALVLPGIMVVSILNDYLSSLKDGYHISSIVWFKPISSDSMSEIILKVGETGSDTLHVDVLSGTRAEILYEVRLKKGSHHHIEKEPIIFEKVAEDLNYYRDHEEIYEDFAKKNMIYGPNLRILSCVQWNELSVLSTINPKMVNTFESVTTFPFHLLEAGLQSLGVFSKSQQLPFRAGELQVYDSLAKTHFTYAIRNGEGYLFYFLGRSFKILATLSSLTLKESTPGPLPQPSPISNGKEIFLNGNSENVGNTSSLESYADPTQLNLFIPFWSIVSLNESLANEPKTEALIFSEPHRHQEIEAIKSAYSLSTFIPINDQYTFLQDKIEYSVDSQNLSDIFIFCPAIANPMDGKNLRNYLSGFSQLLQKIMTANPSLVSRKLRITVFTFNGFVIDPNDQPSYEANVIRGFASVLGKEIENWSVCVVDLSSSSDFDLEMVSCFNKGIRFVAIRNGTVLEKKWHPFNWSEKNRGFKREGVYVIIGGAGGLGSSLTQYLVTHYNASVIILGRRERSQLSPDTVINDNLVSYIQADCTNKVALDEALVLIKQKYHKIDGVIHSPLILQDHPIFSTTQDMIDKVTLCKIDGTLNALDVFRQELLDFFLIFSSVNSFLPQQGQASYSSACSFQDACQYMEYPCAIKIVNWGFWSETGAVARQDFRDRFFKQGLFSINPTQAWEDIDHFLASDVSQIAYIPATEEYYQKAGIFELGDLSGY